MPVSDWQDDLLGRQGTDTVILSLGKCSGERGAHRSDAFNPCCALFLGQGSPRYSEMAANIEALICWGEFRFSDFASRVI